MSKHTYKKRVGAAGQVNMKNLGIFGNEFDTGWSLMG